MNSKRILFSAGSLLIISLSCTKVEDPIPANEIMSEPVFKTKSGTATVTINAGNVGNVVDSMMFGGVFEGHRMSISEPNVQAALNVLKPTFLRYPGGTYAVSGYHYRDSEDGEGYMVGDCVESGGSNCDTQDGVSSFNTERETATTHTEFLSYCQSHSIIPQLIIPSDRYTNVSPGLGLAAGRAYAKNFLTDINLTPDANHPDPGHTAHQKVKYWNLGNEDYPASINFDYATMAKHYANDLVALDNTIKPTVNWKWNVPQDAQNLAATLGTATYRGIFTNVLEPNENYSESDILSHIQQGVNSFPAGKRDLQIGAWQVATDPNWAWMRSASIFSRRFATFVRAGAKIACYWPIINTSAERQSRLVNGGSSPSLAPCGQLFKWLYISATGKYIVEGVSISNPNGIHIAAYRNYQSSTIVVFVSGNNAPTDTQVDLNLTNFNVQSATGERMSEGVESGTGTQVSSQPVVTTLTPTVTPSANKVSFKINKNTKWEIARIIIKTT